MKGQVFLVAPMTWSSTILPWSASLSKNFRVMAVKRRLCLRPLSCPARVVTPLRIPTALRFLERCTVSSVELDSSDRHPPRCHTKTRTRLRRDILYRFINPNRPHCLWILGPVGVGKSAIAQTIGEFCKSKWTLGAAFFFSRIETYGTPDANLNACLRLIRETLISTAINPFQVLDLEAVPSKLFGEPTFKEP